MIKYSKKEVKAMTRRQSAGVKMADALIEFIHLMYQKQTARGVLQSLILRLKNKERDFE